MFTTPIQRTARLVLAALGLFTLASAVDAGSAEASDRSFWVIADRPGYTSGPYRPKASINWTGAADPQLQRTRRGDYVLRYWGAGAVGGNVQVSAMGIAARHCKVRSWEGNGFAQSVRVRCFDYRGRRADTAFSLQFVQGGSDRAYLMAYLPTTRKEYRPTGNLRYSSEAGTFDYAGSPRVRRLGRGRYSVYFPGFDVRNSDVQVTAYGSGNERCEPATFGYRESVVVDCVNPRGRMVDTRFSILVDATPIHFDGFVAKVWGLDSGAYVETMSNRTGRSVTTARLGVGNYRITIDGARMDGSPVVTAVGRDGHCWVGSMRERVLKGRRFAQINVSCFDVRGRNVDSSFTIRHRID